MVSPRYAAGTEVPTDRSRAEIEKTLRRYGASQFVYAWDDDRAILGFTAHQRQIRFVIPLPDPNGREFTVTETGRQRSATAAADAYERAVRQRWRVLALVVKAKLEAVAAGLVAFEDEFLPFTVLPGGQTVADVIRGGVAEAYRTGQVPPLMPDYRRAIESGQR
jgi:hypothetical protein